MESMKLARNKKKVRNNIKLGSIIIMLNELENEKWRNKISLLLTEMSQKPPVQ